MQPVHPVARDLVLVGGGHAHALVLRSWRRRGLAGARVTLVSPDPTTIYSAMLPGFVAGAYVRRDIEIDLARLARAADATLVLDRAIGIEPARRRLLLADRPPIDYDVLSINTGSFTRMANGAQTARNLLPIKPMDKFVSGWSAFLTRAPDAPRIAIIGAGVGGLEIAFAIARRLSAASGRSITLLERGADIAPGVSPRARAMLKVELEAAGITLKLDTEALESRRDRLRLSDGDALKTDLQIWAVGASAPKWIRDLRLETTEDGFLRVDPHLRSISDPSIFVAGDAAHMEATPRAKAGVYAVRQAGVLAENLRAALADAPLSAFAPQRGVLRLISLSDGRAIADKSGVALRGAWAWRWKDRIDRRFIAQFDKMRAMAPRKPRTPAFAASGAAQARRKEPLCGACGAKIGLAQLTAAFEQLEPAERAAFVSGLGDDAAILPTASANELGDGLRVASTDLLRAFTDDARLFGRVAAIHALGDIWAMGATPEGALLNVVLPEMSPEKQIVRLREMLGGVAIAFAEAEARIIGGHSSEGAEMSLGLTVIGRAPPDGALTLDRAAPDQALILTKPLGVGVILAADMLGVASGETVRVAHRQMLTQSGDAARALRQSGAEAMTDVTGFGLLGHLGRMLTQSGVDAELLLEAIPFLQGAVALAHAGHRSSLYAANLAAAPIIEGQAFDLRDPRAQLLFDPQTCGGMLAAMPAESASAALEALKRRNQRGWIIGRLHRAQDNAPRISLT